MGRKADMRPKFGRTTYEAKLRKPREGHNRNGDKIEGGKVFSRHFEANNVDGAQKIAQRFAKKLGSKVISITKVHPEDIIGDYTTWNLKDIIGKPVERRRDVILDNVTLSEIVYNKRK